MSRCPICHTAYDQIEARILGEDADTRLIHLTCHECSNALLALVLVTPAGISSVGLLTDLSYDDVLRFGQSSVITTNDVILAHQELKEAGFLTKLPH